MQGGDALPGDCQVLADFASEVFTDGNDAVSAPHGRGAAFPSPKSEPCEIGSDKVMEVVAVDDAGLVGTAEMTIAVIADVEKGRAVDLPCLGANLKWQGHIAENAADHGDVGAALGNGDDRQ